MSRNRLLSGVAAVAMSVMFSASAAKADLIQVGLQAAGAGTPAGSITLDGSSVSGSMTWSIVTYGNFTTTGTSNDTKALGLPAILYSNTIDVSSLGTGSITVYVVASQQSSLKGLTNWTTTLSTNESNGDTVTEADYFEDSNVTLTAGESSATLLSGATLLQSQNLSGLQTVGPLGNSQPSVTTPWSVIEVYTITATAADEHFNDTIDLNATIPEPASLSLLGGGLLAFGAWRRRRNQKA